MINNKHIVYTKDRTFELNEMAVSGNSNLLRVEATGICGTDRHIISGKKSTPLPIILGHEVVGTIENISSRDTLLSDWRIEEGDRVLLAPGIRCNRCFFCQSGSMLCENYRVYGLNMMHENTGHSLGGFSEYMTLLPGTRLFKVPTGIESKTLILAEILAAGIRAVKKLIPDNKQVQGKDLFIQGAGSVGLCTALYAKLLGFNILISDYLEHRLEMAARFGLATISVARVSRDDSNDLVRKHFGGRGPEFVIECTGELEAVEQAYAIIRKGGKIVIFGNYVDVGTLALNTSFICNNDIEIIGTSVTYPEDLLDGIRMIQYANFPIQDLVTRTFRLSDYAAAFEYAMQRKGIKAVFTGAEQ